MDHEDDIASQRSNRWQGPSEESCWMQNNRSTHQWSIGNHHPTSIFHWSYIHVNRISDPVHVRKWSIVIMLWMILPRHGFSSFHIVWEAGVDCLRSRASLVLTEWANPTKLLTRGCEYTKEELQIVPTDWSQPLADNDSFGWLSKTSVDNRNLLCEYDSTPWNLLSTTKSRRDHHSDNRRHGLFFVPVAEVYIIASKNNPPPEQKRVRILRSTVIKTIGVSGVVNCHNQGTDPWKL